MENRLASLLERIDPRLTLDDADRRSDEALNSFSWPSPRITEWPKFQQCLMRFHRHVETRMIGAGKPFSGADSFDWGRCIGTLLKAFGKNGDKVAFELARTGTEGGLHRVLRDVTTTLVHEYAENWVACLVWNYWNGLSIDEQLAAPGEYLRQYGHLLPSELTEGKAGRVQADFPRVLQEHPRLIRRLRAIGRT